MTFDYDSVKDRLINNLRSKASWADVLFFSTNSRLIDSVAEGIAEFASYDEFLTRNTKWDLATEKSALVSQSQFMQYDAHRKIGGTGFVRVSASPTFDSPPTKIVPFPKWTVFSDGTNKFTSVLTTNMLTTDNYIDLKVFQGEPKTFNYVANGEEYEEISITNSIIENENYEVWVNGTLWVEIKDLNAAGSTDTVYTLKNKLNFDGIDITFGNSIFGTKLQSGDSVTFKYLETLGVSGNILGVNIITTVDSTIYDIDVDQIDIFCTNTSNIDGGNDEEDLEDIRTNGINTFQAGDKAVAQKDYKVKLEESPYIFKSTVWGAFEYNIDNNVDLWTYIPTEENIVNVSAFTPSGEQLTDEQKIKVITGIKEDKPPTDIITFIDANFIYLIFHIKAFVEDVSNALSIVKSDIISQVSEEYGIINREFRQPLYETDWKGFINGIDGVTYHSSYIELSKYETLNEAYLGDINLDIFPISKESVYIYIKDTTIVDDPFVLLGIDDGDGIFINEIGYDITGSSINYTTGEGIINIVSGVTGDFDNKSIRILYKPDSINTVLNGRNQIFKIEEISDVTAVYILE